MTSEIPKPTRFTGEYALIAMTGNYPAPDRVMPPALRRVRYVLLEVAEAGGFLLLRVKCTAQSVDPNGTFIMCGDAIPMPDCPSAEDVAQLLEGPMPGSCGVAFDCYRQGHRTMVTELRWYADRPYDDSLKEILLGAYRPDSDITVSRKRVNISMPTSYL